MFNKLFALSALIIFLFFPIIYSNAQINITGKVIDSDSGESLAGVNIIVKGTSYGTATSRNGSFYLKASVGVPCDLQFSMLGYKLKEVRITEKDIRNLQVELAWEAILGEEVVVKAKVIEVEKKTFEKEISIEMIDALGIRETPAANFYEAIRNLKGVDVVMQSMQFISINARGFNSTENTRFVQIVDGMDNQAPGMNFPIGNIAGLNELDVESIEFIPGPAEVQFGGNALNGILKMNSKDPFKHQGVSAYVKPGISDIVAGSDYPFQFFGKAQMDGGIRIAKAYKNKIAFKFNASYIGGKDWNADDTTNIRPGNIKWEHDPGHDAINKYGDEIISDLPVGERYRNVIVSRTGYKDKELVDNRTKNFKFNGSVHYKLKDSITLILHGNYGNATTVYTGDNRTSLSGFEIYQGKAAIIGNHFSLQAYSTFQNSGNSYDAKFLAVHLNNAAKNDAQWFHEYSNAYRGNYRRFGIPGADHFLARGFADRKRLIPGTPEFEEEKNRIISDTDFRKGAGIKNNSALHHIDGVIDFDKYTGKSKVKIGGNYRFYDLESGGSIFPDTLGNNITFFEMGGFIDVSRKFLNEKLLLKGSLRLDKGENFDPVLSPRIYALYTINENRNFRASILTGHRTPGVKEQFINKDLGTARYLGGLNQIFDPYDIPGNGIYLDNVNAFNAAVDADVSNANDPYGVDQARIKNLQILESGITTEEQFQKIVPEKVLSFELGYKTKFRDAFFVDLVYYNSIYNNFIGITKVVKPKTSPAISLITAATQVNKSSQNDVYYVNVNSKKTVGIQGVSMGYKWLMPMGSILSGNMTFSDVNSAIDDPVVPGFNTPGFKSNLSLANRRMDKMENNPGFRNIGFMVTWRYQSRFYWESAFGDGWIEPVSTFDVQVSVNLRKPKSVVKMGASNFFNNSYNYSFGGANIGVLYYVSYIIDDIFSF